VFARQKDAQLVTMEDMVLGNVARSDDAVVYLYGHSDGQRIGGIGPEAWAKKFNELGIKPKGVVVIACEAATCFAQPLANMLNVPVLASPDIVSVMGRMNESGEILKIGDFRRSLSFGEGLTLRTEERSKFDLILPQQK